MSEANVWVEFAKSFGLPSAILVGVLIGLYRLGRLYVMEVAKPMSMRLIASIDHTDRVVDEQAKVLGDLNTNLRLLHDDVRDVKDKLTK